MYRHYRCLLFFLICVFFVQTLSAQAVTEATKKIRQQRQSRIEFYHVSVGGSVAANRNITAGLQLSVGVGSFRNIVNADFGFRYLFKGQFPKKGFERVSLQQFPIFMSVRVNFFRWRTGSVFLGGEMAFVVNTSGKHYLPNVTGSTADINIGKSHFSPAAMLGVRVNHVDICVFYEYDMKPPYNQKYIYETKGFDYDILRPMIFERMRMGVRFLYHFNF